jgi:rhodanese-related sulfurtransferase
MAVGLKDMVAEARERVRGISPAELSERLEGPDAPLVVDVREPGEWSESHIPGSLNVPRGLLELRADPDSPVTDASLSARKESPVVLYCTQDPGARSLLSAQTLEAMGYTEVCALSGGLNAWRDQGLPVE